MPVRGNLRAILADYSPTGSVYMSTFMNEDGSPDSTCSNMNAVAGAYVNYCFVVESYAFKFQIVSGASTVDRLFSLYCPNVTRTYPFLSSQMTVSAL